jgi:hypothetical protein
MKIQRFCVPLFLVFSLAFLQAQAQTQTDTTQLWQIELQNENTYIGKIISRDSETIVFDSQELGIINIQVQNIKSMKAIKASQIREGEYWAENPQSTRYFWSPNRLWTEKGRRLLSECVDLFQSIQRRHFR